MMNSFQTNRFKLPIAYWLFLLFLSVGASFVEGNRQQLTAPIERVDILAIQDGSKSTHLFRYQDTEKQPFHGYTKSFFERSKFLISKHLSAFLMVKMKLHTLVYQDIAADLINVPAQHLARRFPIQFS